MILNSTISILETDNNYKETDDDKIVIQENIQEKTQTISFQKPAAKGAIKMIDAENIDQLITLLQNEAKVL